MPRLGTLLLLALVALTFAASPANGADASGWDANALQWRGQNGSRFVIDCPPLGTLGGIYGTDIYTDDSRICTAAVHVGLITLAGGGTVTIEIRPDAGSYTGTTRNRVTSASYGAWGGAYVIVAAIANNPGPQAPPAEIGTDPWVANATTMRQWIGGQFQFNCPAGGKPHAVWGRDIYTDDSSVCTAAVHGGLITFQKGGKVVIEMRDGQSSYAASKRNGVTTNKYGPWPGSYIVVDAPDGPDTPEGVATGDVTVNGQPFTSGPVRYGSTVDVTGGTLQLTAAGVGSILTFGDGTDLAQYKLNKVVDKVGNKKRTTAELALNGGDFSGCTPGAARAAGGPAGKVVRALWANGKGRFRTKGKYASAAIRGTKWETSDQCDGTLTTVTEGAVTVRDFALKKNVVVKAGGSYLAKSP
jgi:hypothetical protein